MPVLPSYSNQSTDLLCKSIDSFLYEGNTGNYLLLNETLIIVASGTTGKTNSFLQNNFVHG